MTCEWVASCHLSVKHSSLFPECSKLQRTHDQRRPISFLGLNWAAWVEPDGAMSLALFSLFPWRRRASVLSFYLTLGQRFLGESEAGRIIEKRDGSPGGCLSTCSPVMTAEGRTETLSLSRRPGLRLARDHWVLALPRLGFPRCSCDSKSLESNQVAVNIQCCT